MEPKNVVVIGGGFAGAAASSALAEAGHYVTLLEQRPTLGGRTSSVRDGVTKEDVDNGPHLFLGCYRDTRYLLDRLRVADRLPFFKSFALSFVLPGGGRAALKPRALPGGLGFVAGLLAFSELRFRDKLSLLRGLTSFALNRHRDLSGHTVSQWLDGLRQRPGARRAFWEPLCLATLNERPERASAAALAVVLRDGFLGKPEDRALGYATLGLSKLWTVELTNYLRRQGGTVAARQKATGFRVADGRVRAVTLEGGTEVEADAVISAVPLSAFMELVPEDMRFRFAKLAGAEPSPIASVNLWFSKAPFEEPVLGFLDTNVQWGFNRRRQWGEGRASEGYVSLVFSAARAHAARTSDELIALAMQDLRRCFPSFREEPRHATVMWERQATPSPTPDFWRARPPVATSLSNLFLAGDWVDVGLPPTIEAAARSGHRAAAAARTYLEAPAC